MSDAHPRIVLIHALRESQVPAWRAFEAGWPEARIFNLLDDSLSADLASDGGLTDAMIERFLTLGRYAAGTGADGILFTCSAFGRAIAAVRDALAIPVLRPNEAAFEAALDAGRRIGLMVTFPQALPPLKAELEAMAAERGKTLEVVESVAEGALAALQNDRMEEHDHLAVAAAEKLPMVDALVLGQFSLARAAGSISKVFDGPVLTTPDAAVAKMRGLLAGST